MAEIDVMEKGEGVWRVEILEGGSRTTHQVTVSEASLRKYGAGAGAEELLEASFEFLLEREPKESILAKFDLTVIERYFPEYPDEIRRRVG